MANLPQTVNINLSDAVTLLNYYYSAAHNHLVGDLGVTNYDAVITSINEQSTIRISPKQLESLVFHMQQAIFEKISPRKVEIRAKSYYGIMRRLKDAVPHLFKTLPSGEIVFINFEDREDVK